MNKAVRCLALYTAVLLLMSSCSSQPQDNGEIREISSFTNLCNNGELYVDNDKVVFYDFMSMTSSPVCSKPNCAHNSSKTCSAYDMYGVPFIYNDKIYYFDTNIEDNGDDSYSDTTDVYTAALNGADRNVINTFDELCFYPESGMYLVGGDLYLFAAKHSFSPYGSYGGEQKAEIHLCRYNLPDNSLTDILLLGNDYLNGGTFFGVFDGCIYLSYSYSEEPIRYQDIFTEIEKADFKYRTYKYDLKSKEIVQCDIDNIHSISGGWMIIEDGSNCIMRNEKGEEAAVDEACGSFDCIINDKAFSGYYGFCIDLPSGEKHKLNFAGEDAPTANIRYEVKDYIDGRYIIQAINYAENSREYISLTEDELIGEEA